MHLFNIFYNIPVEYALQRNERVGVLKWVFDFIIIGRSLEI